MKVIKRTGESVEFDSQKIQSAVLKAFEAVDKVDDFAITKAKNIADFIYSTASSLEHDIHISEIQTLVENGLMSLKNKDIARAYIIYRENKDKNRNLAFDLSDCSIVKKDGTIEKYNIDKIKIACDKAASRAMVKLTDNDYNIICHSIEKHLRSLNKNKVDIYEIHNIVEASLEEHFPQVAKTYKEYRNYKKDFIHMMDNVYAKSQSIRYIGDNSNANTDSTLVATKRSLIYNELSSELYKKFFLNQDERQATKDGYIYIHDRSARLDTWNCCLARVGTVMKNGFEMGNIWYNEPNSLDTAFDVMGDIILSTAAQEYGGYTVSEIDKILEPYAEKSLKKYKQEYIDIATSNIVQESPALDKKAIEYAYKKVQRDFEQGWQGLEYKLNTVGSSRGDYPFVTVTIGLATSKLGKMAAITLLNVHKEGQGKEGFKRPVLFPKIVFLYDKDLHGDGSIEYPNADVFNAGLECSSKTMYPDWLSLTGENGHVSEIYKKYKKVISPMGK